jgi:hypothetical protein
MKIFFCFFVLYFNLSSFAQIAGPNPTSTGSNQVVAGSNGIWTSLGNATTSNNAYVLSAALPTAATFTDRFVATGFGFSIPAGNVITGIEVVIERSVTGGVNITDNEIMLVKGGVTQTATNKATAAIWPTSDAVATYGGGADLWGNTWTLADINSGNFGVAVSAKRIFAAGAPRNARIDFITITVYYTAITPVTIKDFNAILNVKFQSVALSWTSLDEENVSHYTIERSVNNLPFTAIGNLPASTIIANEKKYTFEDVQAAVGLNLYRLVSVDLDGQRKISPIVGIKNSNKQYRPISLLLNQAGNHLTIIVGEGIDYSQPVIFQLIDVTGKLHLQNAIRFTGLGEIKSIETPCCLKGIYYLVWYQNAKRGTHSLLLQ